MTMFFLIVILGATDKRAPAGFAPIAIGLCLTLIHLISIPVTNTSVNPARSTGVALFVGGWAIGSCGCSGWRRSSAPCSVPWPTAPSPARRAEHGDGLDQVEARDRDSGGGTRRLQEVGEIPDHATVLHAPNAKDPLPLPALVARRNHESSGESI